MFFTVYWQIYGVNGMAAERLHKHIAIRIIASAIIANVLFIICAITYSDIKYLGYDYYAPRDYLGSESFDLNPAWNDFVVTVIISFGILLISILFIWKLLNLKWRLAAAGFIIVLVVGGTVLYLNTEYASEQDILEIYETGSWLEEVNLTYYEPFRENTLAKSLDETASLSLSDHLPRLDGATALYPLYAAFARATYPAAEYKAYDINSGIACSRTSGAFANLLDGKVDLIFLMGVSEEQREQANELGLKLVLTPIGKEAFVFFVNNTNSMSNLSVGNIKDIYSGNITNWFEVGGDNIEILAYQRPGTSGSQIMLKEIMGDVPIIEAPGNNYFDEMMGMYMAVAYKNHKNALGYSFLYYINDMIAENKIKFLSINGIEPTAANIACGDYPFAHDFYAITVIRQNAINDEKLREDNTQRLIEWILTPQGQSLVGKTGYVPLP